MRWRALALLSLGINLWLIAAWLMMPRRPLAASSSFTTNTETAVAGTGRPNVVLRRQFFSWQEVESPDYPTYILNLRNIGCPEQTIRDIIIADVNALYSRKLATNLVTAEQQWWRSEPDPEVVEAAAEKVHAAEEE